MALSLQQLAELAGAELIGDGTCMVHHAADITQANEGDIAFVYTAKYAQYIKGTRASALVVSRDLVEHCTMPVLVSDDPRLTFAKVVAALYPDPGWMVGISANAFVHEEASVDMSVRVEDGAVIGAGVIISAGAYIGANCVIGEHVTIGANTRIHANSTIYHHCIIGDDCLIHAGVVIGADGFGFVRDGEHYLKVPQIGRVHIGNNVEIGACTSIDRGALSDTVIEDGVKIDNQIQIGHNVRIGHDTVVSACTCIAGSAKIGAHCLIGGSVGIRDNIEIADHVVITGRTFVSSSITEAGVYSSSILMDTNENWRRNVARFKKLDDMAKRLKNLEKKSQ